MNAPVAKLSGLKRGGGFRAAALPRSWPRLFPGMGPAVAGKPIVRRSDAPASGQAQAASRTACLVLGALVLDWIAVVLKWVGSVAVFQGQDIGYYVMTPDDSRLARIARLFAFALFLVAGILAAVKRRTRLPAWAGVLLVVMLDYCAFWTLWGYEPSEYIDRLLSVWSPMGFLMCLGLFAGMDESLWRWMRPVTLALAYASMLLGVYTTLRYSLTGTFEGATPMVEYLQLVFWLSWVTLIVTPLLSVWKCVPVLIPMASCIPMAILISSRSFTLLAVLSLGLALLFSFHRWLRRSALKAVGVFLLAALSVTLIVGGLAVSAPERLEVFQARILEDTRTSQYSQFFQQVSVLDLIPGLGPKATYTLGERTNFEYIDNQFLFMAFKLGVPVLIGYCAVILWPGLRLLFKAANPSQRMIGLVFLLWSLATLGISIFHGIVPNPQNFLIILLAGRAFSVRIAPPAETFVCEKARGKSFAVKSAPLSPAEAPVCTSGAAPAYPS